VNQVARRGAMIVASVVVLFVARAMFEGEAAMRRAERADNDDAAIAYALRATKWYVPFASHPRRGYDSLRAIARRAESVGDIETALIAWQAIRAGTHATRSFYMPFEDRAKEADAQIAILLASRAPAGIDRDKPREKIVQEHRQELARTDGPNALAVVALYAGLAVGLFGAYRALSRVPDADVDRRRRLTSLALAAGGFLLVLIAFARA
jgi:hypothetical protein